MDTPAKGNFPFLGMGEYVSMSVRDDGVGIAKEDQERIFEPFYTTKQDNMGTGLGLAVVRNIVTGMGGGIIWKASLAKGRNFRFLFQSA